MPEDSQRAEAENAAPPMCKRGSLSDQVVLGAERLRVRFDKRGNLSRLMLARVWHTVEISKNVTRKFKK
jgi:hypothetical protein